MTEQQLQKKMIDYLDKEGAWTIKTISTNKRGTPDILACLDGKFLAIEVKAKGRMSTLSKLQQFQLRQVESAGGYALACDDFNQFKKVIERWKTL